MAGDSCSRRRSAARLVWFCPAGGNSISLRARQTVGNSHQRELLSTSTDGRARALAE